MNPYLIKKIGYYTKVSIHMVAYVLQYNILIFLILTVAIFLYEAITVANLIPFSLINMQFDIC